MKKNGFTLIELLAVIIVLAIIALIAMPIIFNVIENAKVKSLENSAYGVVDAVRLHYTENLLNTDNGEVPLTGRVTSLSLSGEHPTGGTWIIQNGKEVTEGRGIKIIGVTFASMQDFVCNSEEVNGKLTGKVICCKKSPITLAVDANDDGIAELGDEVCIGNECFYVLTNDGTNIRMLAKYRIDVSNNTTRKDRLQSTTGTLDTVFSSDDIKGVYYSSYEGSIVEDLVGDYKITVERLGVTINEATLLAIGEAKEAPFNCTTLHESCDPTYSWLYKDGNTTAANHWTSSAVIGSNIYVWYVNSSGSSQYPEYNRKFGVRPVITIATSALN